MKKYIKPQIVIHQLTTNVLLIDASADGEKFNTTNTKFGGGTVDSRGGSIWDDDEEEY